MNCLFIMFVEEHSSCGIHYRFGNRTRSDEISTVCTDWFTAVVIVNMTLFFPLQFVLCEHGLICIFTWPGFPRQCLHQPLVWITLSFALRRENF